MFALFNPLPRHSYAAGITLSVGCLLLILNMLIFAAIYYQRQVCSTNRAAQNLPPPDLQPTTSIPSYYLTTDCDSLDLSRIEKCINKQRELQAVAAATATTSTAAAPVEKIEVPQRTGILLKHGADDCGGKGTLKPKKRVHINTDVSIV